MSFMASTKDLLEQALGLSRPDRATLARDLIAKRLRDRGGYLETGRIDFPPGDGIACEQLIRRVFRERGEPDAEGAARQADHSGLDAGAADLHRLRQVVDGKGQVAPAGNLRRNRLPGRQAGHARSASPTRCSSS